MTARTAPDPAISDRSVRVAGPPDAPRLAECAARTFTATYARSEAATGPVATSAPDDVAAYVGAAFTVERMRAELADPTLVTFVAEPTRQPASGADGADGWAGYAQLRLEAAPHAPVPPPCAGPHPRELARFYVERAWQGRGVADRLMDAVVARAQSAPGGASPLWLAVYQANARALAFYRRRGFEVVGTTTFTMGAELQHDWLMVWRP